MTLKVNISDTTLRLFIPSQVRKTTPKLHQICRCNICIIPKYMNIYLNRFRTRLVIYLRHNSIGRHAQNSLFSTTRDVNYKDKVFPFGECLHATRKDVAHCITCITIKQKNIIHIKCDLFFLMNVMSTVFPTKN